MSRYNLLPRVTEWFAFSQYCLSTAGSQPIEDVAKANDLGASTKNESNSVHTYDGPNGGDAKSPRFFQLYMGHDDEIVSPTNYHNVED